VNWKKKKENQTMSSISDLQEEYNKLQNRIEELEKEIEEKTKSGKDKYKSLYCEECGEIASIDFKVTFKATVRGSIFISEDHFEEDGEEPNIDIDDTDRDWEDTSLEANCPGCHNNWDIDVNDLPDNIRRIASSVDDDVRDRIFRS
jgi:Zn finger protein HypA/HybF involved in hydrogenase expression